MATIFAKYSLEILVVVGVLVGTFVIWQHHETLGVRMKGTLGLCALYLAAMVFSIKAFADLENFISAGNTDNGEAISALGIYLIGSPLVLIVSLLLRLKTPVVMDVYGLGVSAAMIAGRMNCLRGGCCIGLEIFHTGLRWPVREVEILFNLSMFLYNWRKIKKGENPGQALPLTMLCYGIFRFCLQWFRYTLTGGWVQSHFWALLCAFIGLSVLLELRSEAQRKQKKQNPKQKKRASKK